MSLRLSTTHARVCLVLFVTVLATTASDASAAAPARLFSPSSIWNTALSPGSPLEPGSAARVKALAAVVEHRQARGLYPNIAANAYSTPIYRVGPRTARVPVQLDVGQWGASLRSVVAGGVPIPAQAAPALGTDGHMTVYQASSDTLWEFWKARKAADGWHANWGGAMRNVSTNPGYYSGAAWPGLDKTDGWNWGSTATSLPVAAGTVTRAELRRGRIDHVLAAGVPDPCRGMFTWPAQRTDGGSVRPDCMPEGAHLRLDPSVDLRALHLPRVTRILARAAQKYGLVVRDRTGGSVSFYFESPAPRRPGTYTGPGGLYGGVPGWKLMANFPWRRLQLQKMTLCARAPCLPTQTGA